MGGKKNRGFLAAAVGIVAAVALPFAVPAIASAIGASAAVSPLVASTIAGGLYGAGTGALAGSITGDVGRGALLGGAGGTVGGFIQGGGLDAASNALFGSGTETVVNYTRPEVATVAPMEVPAQLTGVSVEPLAAPAGTAAAANAPGALSNYEALTAPIAAAPSGAAGAGIGSAAAAPGVAASGAAAPTTTAGVTSGAAPGFSISAAQPAATGTFGERFMAGVTGGGPSVFSAEGAGRAVGGLLTPSGLASVGQLAMTMYNRPPQDLTPEERNYVNETAEMAATNRAMFEERVSAARRLLQQGGANPEQAFAQTQMGVERRFREAGLRTPEEARRAAIEGARLGAAAVSGEQARAATATQAGLSAMPTTAPVGAATLALPAYRDVERREREYYADLARGVGGLAGALGGTRSKSSLFA